MSRIYTVKSPSGGSTIASGGSIMLAFVNPPASRAIKILRAWASQKGTTTSAQLEIQLGTKATAFPTLTSATPQPTNTFDNASRITGGTAGAAGTAGINASVAGAGTFTPIYPDVFNNLVGWIWTPNANLNEPMVFSGADSLGCGLLLVDQPGTLTGWHYGIEFEEIS